VFNAWASRQPKLPVAKNGEIPARVILAILGANDEVFMPFILFDVLDGPYSMVST
jgi:hypothetical protein